jgi:hypothetical protein
MLIRGYFSSLYLYDFRICVETVDSMKMASPQPFLQEGPVSIASESTKHKNHRKRLPPRAGRAGIDYLKTEIEIGIVFARMALCSEDSKKTDRNRGYALAAYEAVRRFTSSRHVILTIAAADLAVLEAKLTYLRARLRQLEESFPK